MSDVPPSRSESRPGRRGSHARGEPPTGAGCVLAGLGVTAALGACLGLVLHAWMWR